VVRGGAVDVLGLSEPTERAGGATGFDRGQVEDTARLVPRRQCFVHRRHPDVGPSRPRCVALDEQPESRDRRDHGYRAPGLPSGAFGDPSAHGHRAEAGDDSETEQSDDPRAPGRAQSGPAGYVLEQEPVREVLPPAAGSGTQPEQHAGHDECAAGDDRAALPSPAGDRPDRGEDEQHRPRERGLAVHRPVVTLAEERPPQREARVRRPEVGAERRHVRQLARERRLILLYLEVRDRERQRAGQRRAEGEERHEDAARAESSTPDDQHDGGGAERVRARIEGDGRLP